MKFIAPLACILLATGIGTITAQTNGVMNVDAETKRQVVSTLSEDLLDHYVFADVAKEIVAKLKSNQADYMKTSSAREFASMITKDMQSINNDSHLFVRYSPRKLPIRKNRAEPTDEEIRFRQVEMARRNYGFESVRRLEGNIGYIDLRKFMDHELGENTLAAAMNFVQNTDALIIDLRQNNGGSPEMVALISSYFVGDKEVHLNSFYTRKSDSTKKFFTSEDVKGAKYGDKDLYILTSRNTFSAAEGFSYHLKNLKRATIVGETTGGGAHPGEVFRLHDHFSAFIATGRAINPITKTNWEGVGVKPHIPTSKEAALDTAIIKALEKIAASVASQHRRASIERQIIRTKERLKDDD